MKHTKLILNGNNELEYIEISELEYIEREQNLHDYMKRVAEWKLIGRIEK